MASTEELSYAYLDSHPNEAARVLERLAPQDCAAFLNATPLRLAVPVLRRMLALNAARCLERLDTSAAAGLLQGIGPQAGAAVLRHLPEPRRAPLIAQLATPTAVALRLLLSYSADTVGGWMDPHVLAVPADLPVSAVLDRVKQSEPELVGDIYVLDQDQRLRGVVDVADLLRIDGRDPVTRISRAAPPTLPARSPLGAVREHAGWTDHRVLPVVERGERFVGVLAYAVLIRVLTRDAQAHAPPSPGTFGGIVGSYWRGVSGVIEAAIEMLPVAPPQASSVPAHDDQR